MIYIYIDNADFRVWYRDTSHAKDVKVISSTSDSPTDFRIWGLRPAASPKNTATSASNSMVSIEIH